MLTGSGSRELTINRKAPCPAMINLQTMLSRPKIDQAILGLDKRETSNQQRATSITFLQTVSLLVPVLYQSVQYTPLPGDSQRLWFFHYRVRQYFHFSIS